MAKHKPAKLEAGKLHVQGYRDSKRIEITFGDLEVELEIDGAMRLSRAILEACTFANPAETEAAFDRYKDGSGGKFGRVN